jgi:lipid-A-disaccharide synthase-like uncharacterized protein
MNERAEFNPNPAKVEPRRSGPGFPLSVPAPNGYVRRVDSLTNFIWHDGKFLGLDLAVWKAIGWVGNAVFFSRFLVQWYATEKLKRVVVPTAFWWLSLSGALLLLVYSIAKRDSVFICAYLFSWIPYIRNLVIHHRHESAHADCPGCGASCAPQSNFCPACGTRLAPAGKTGA